MRLEHVGSMVGRIFLLSSLDAFKKWNGVSENEFGEIDYDLLGNSINEEEAGLGLYSSKQGVNYYVLFSMSSKIEIFTKGKSVILCDGLYFNESFDYAQNVALSKLQSLPYLFEATEPIAIFDATVDAASLNIDLTSKRGLMKSDMEDLAILDLARGTYHFQQIDLNIQYNKESLTLRGIEMSLLMH